MKALFIVGAGFGLAAGFLQAADPAKPPRAEITFEHPERFTDVKDSSFPTDKGRDAILGQLRKTLVSEANYCVPEGCKLSITFSDIDLAGDFEPWLGPNWSNVRIVKDIYPPAFKFTWSVTNAAGRVIKQGKEDMRVLDFDMMITLDREDPLRYEKAILDDWMRSNLRDIKKAVADSRD